MWVGIDPLMGLDRYRQLFLPYQRQLHEFSGREREFGGRFALLFRQVTRLLVTDLPINDRIPRLYLTVAQRYLNQDAAIVRHFSYEDNRHFFLSELHEWLAIHERGRQLRQKS